MSCNILEKIQLPFWETRINPITGFEVETESIYNRYINRRDEQNKKNK